MIVARTPTNFEEYAQDFPPRVRAILRKIRATIRKAVPDAQERISYRMPAFKLKRDIAYFAAFKHHIGFYPPVRGDAALKQAVNRYSGPKGNLRFPLDEPIPYALIARIVKSHAKLDRANAKGLGAASKRRTLAAG
jgi:uncharacterized protein YdhG (YjbR/CyaY superfamily)